MEIDGEEETYLPLFDDRGYEILTDLETGEPILDENGEEIVNYSCMQTEAVDLL